MYAWCTACGACCDVPDSQEQTITCSASPPEHSFSSTLAGPVGLYTDTCCRFAAIQVGYDVDPQCIDASKANAMLNGVAELCSFHQCSPEGRDATTVSHRQYDICMANIFQGDLLALRPTFTALVKPGGTIVMSGILDNEQVRHAVTGYRCACIQ